MAPVAQMERGARPKKARRWTDADLIRAYEASHSMAQIFGRLGLRPGGASYDTVRRHLGRLGLPWPEARRRGQREPASDPVHGTAGTYNNLGCRCGECRAAASAARASWVRSLQNRKFADVPHGTPSGYRNWGCRCEQCTAARAADGRQSTRRKSSRNARVAA